MLTYRGAKELEINFRMRQVLPTNKSPITAWQIRKRAGMMNGTTRPKDSQGRCWYDFIFG